MWVYKADIQNKPPTDIQTARIQEDAANMADL